MKSLKKRLNAEFDLSAPALKQEVLNAPIITAEGDAPDVYGGNTLIKRRAGIAGVCAAAAIALLFALLGILGVFSPAPVTDRFVFTLEINPAVCFVTDGGGEVKSVTALNGDADVILSDESTLNKLKNVPLNKAVVEYTDCAARLGYLDLTSPTAVRLTGCTQSDEALLDGASENLRTYFKDNGIYAAVVEQTVAVSELSGIIGIEASTVSELADGIDGLSVCYGERISADADEEGLQSVYESYIVGSQMLEYVRGELLGNIKRIAENAEMLSEMVICNYNIMMHKQNPFNPIPADYWTVKKYSSAEQEPQFAELMTQMEELLSEYEQRFGVRVESIAELKAAADVYSSLAQIDFEELFSSLTPEDFVPSAEKYVGILRNLGFDTSVLETLLSVPKTAQEYLSKMQTALSGLFDSRLQKYADIYNGQRESISQSDYDEFINGILSDYGSLENFWEKK